LPRKTKNKVNLGSLEITKNECNKNLRFLNNHFKEINKMNAMKIKDFQAIIFGENKK